MRSFNIETNGYNREEVNHFIGEVNIRFNKIITRCKNQDREISELNKELEHYKSIESTIKSNAKDDASIIVNDALLEASRIESSVLSLKKEMKELNDKFKNITELQECAIDDIEKIWLD